MKNISKKMISISLLGFASGLPLALVGTTLQAWFTEANVSLMGIGALTLVGQPYIYKFLWAPFMDRFVPPLLGRRRGWILFTQILLSLSFIFIAFLHPKNQAWLIGGFAVVIAFFAASQDIAIDAYRTDILLEKERGIGSAFFTGGYRVAMIVSSGLALILAGVIGFKITYIMMGFLMALNLCTTWKSPCEQSVQIPPRNLRKAIVEPFQEFLKRDMAWLILAFLIFYKFGDAFALSLLTPFLMKGVGFSLIDIGLVYKVMGIAASIVGVFVGGLIMMRLKMLKALWIFGILQAISNLMFMLLAIVGKNYILLVLAVGIENFCAGLGTVAFLTFLMSLCDKRYTATQFALFTAISAIGRIFIGPIAAIIVAHYGWPDFFLLSVFISIPGLIILWFIRHQSYFQTRGQVNATNEA